MKIKEEHKDLKKKIKYCRKKKKHKKRNKKLARFKNIKETEIKHERQVIKK